MEGESYKIVIIGDSSVGKSCLMLRFTDNDYQPTYISTIGIDYKIRTVFIDGEPIKIQIWDTAGQERFKTITSAYYRQAQGVMIVYDSNKLGTFHNIEKWISSIRAKVEGFDKPMIIVGNKCDLTPEVTHENLKKLAEKYSALYIEASAKNNTNVEQAFTKLIESIRSYKKNKMNLQLESPPIRVQKPKIEKTKGECCNF